MGRKYEKQDNSTEEQKIALRKRALALVARPVIMETHGGTGSLYLKLYRSVKQGVVFEKHPAKTEVLARQRPTWAVYEADCVSALRAGAGSHLEVNYLDLDPHGNSLEAMDAYLTSVRPFPETLVIVGTDGGRMRVRFTSAWCTKAFDEIVAEFGNDFFGRYLEALEWYLRVKAKVAGYRVEKFGGYYCGNRLSIAHYAAVLKK